jgi:protein ImuA
MPAGDPATLYCLRRAVAQIEGSRLSLEESEPALALGVAAIDAALGGGLACGALHEAAPTAPLHLGAACGFALAISARADTRKDTLWIQPDFAGHEAGGLYGSGLSLLGLPLEKFLLLRVARASDALWAMEEALESRALGLVIAELTEEGSAADLIATRRLTLAAREGGGLGLLLRHRSSPAPSAAMTRWEISASPSRPDVFGGFGPVAFALSLVKNRRGPGGRWTVAWDHHERTFAALPLAVAAAASDRPDRAPLVRAG